jgi:membrane protease YdiL (CAAX protease family)
MDESLQPAGPAAPEQPQLTPPLPPKPGGKAFLVIIEVFLYLGLAAIAWSWHISHAHAVAKVVFFILLLVWAICHRAFGRKTYFNSVELRAGWRFAIFAVILVLIGQIVNAVVRAATHGKGPGPLLTPFGTSAFEALQFGVILLAAFLMSKIERRRMASYGLPLRPAFGKNFWVGILWGFGALSLLLLCMYGTRDMSVGATTLNLGQAIGYGAVWAVGFTLVGFSEEYLFRGYPQFTLTTGMGFWPSALVLSLLFGFAHSGNPGEKPLGLVAVVIVAMFFCLTLWKTGNLWWAVGFHAGWDWGESFFYGTADSGIKATGHLLNPSFRAGADRITGGSVGPEGSVLILPLFVVLFLAFHFAYRRRAGAYPDPAALKNAPHTPQPLPATSA